MPAYRISIVKLVDGSVSFDLDAPDGERLIAGHKLPRNFSVDVSRVGGMTAGPTLRRVVAASGARPWEEEATSVTEGLGLTIRRPSDKHVQFCQDGKVFAQWWPSTGSTLLGTLQGPKCMTGEDVVAWLKSL